MNKRKKIILGILLIIIGFSIFSYQFISNFFNKKKFGEIISTYSEASSELSNEEYNQIIENAQEYNTNLLENYDQISQDNEKYNNQLKLGTTDIIGYITIEKINLELPIYHGTTDQVLQSGIGHVEGTSLPIGGIGTHSMLLGHTGLASSELFTNIRKLKLDDTFKLTILNETLTYTVDDIKIITPKELDTYYELYPTEDYVTLVTCTPYGLNTHRLIVRGNRLKEKETLTEDTIQNEEIKTTNPLKENYYNIYYYYPIILLLIIIIIVSIIFKKIHNDMNY